jgi:hypothetical protein
MILEICLKTGKKNEKRFRELKEKIKNKNNNLIEEIIRINMD